MADNKILIDLQIVQKGDKISLVQKQTDQLSKSQDRLTESRKKSTKQTDIYNRREKGAAQISSNSTKNFSKMQQSIDGGGSGGLVRAYALLAANVFALSAAFGILSRAAQVDTLMESMTQLEITSGRSIKSVGRDLQEAAGFGMDLAAAMRATSLGISAGFDASSLTELAGVARNAAVSLGRNVPDALDRIFRGVIKVEPELLDEIGLFIRVNEASAKYASQLGVAVGDLTEFQKRQAFMNEALEQGSDKFQAFENIEIDAFSQLQTTFVDMTQGILSFINKGLTPIINMFSENKVLFGAVFGIIATTLLRMAVPAMGQFTNTVRENAVETKRAADEAVRIGKIKGQMAAKEHKAELMRKKERLEAEAEEKRFTDKPQQLKVRGRDKSKALEAAMQKELTGKARIQVIEQRLADLGKTRGLEQRMKNAATRREQELLQEELKARLAVLEVEKQINNEKFEGIAKGSFADITQREAGGAAARATGIGNIATAAETQGVKAGLKQIGIQLKAVGLESKKAGASFGFLRKSLFAVRGAATVAAVGMSTLMAAIMGPLSIILMLLPAIQGLLRFIGFNNKAQQELTEANKEAAEVLDILDDRIENATKQMAKFESEGNFHGVNRAMLALSETTLTTITALDKQKKAFEKYQEDTNGFVKAINRTFTFLNPFRKSAFRQMKADQEKFIAEFKKANQSLTPEMQKLMDAQERDPTDENRFAIIEQAEKETNAFKNVVSAIDGAKDSAREYSNSLITKTAVDKPLATFRQLNSSIVDANLSLEQQENLLEEIANDSAVNTLLTVDQSKKLKDGTKSFDERLAVMEEIEQSFFRQQELLIRQKNELAQIASIQKQIKNATKFASTAIEMQFRLTERRRELEEEMLKFDLQRKISATGLTEAEVRRLAMLDSLVGREGELGLTKENIAQVQAAINQMNAIETFESEEQMRLATVKLEKDKAILQANQKLLETELRLNKARIAGADAEAKLEAIKLRGTSKLTPLEEFNLAKEKEDIRLEAAGKEEEIKKGLAKVEFDIVLAQLDVLKHRAQILKDERDIITTQAQTALGNARGGDTLLSTVLGNIGQVDESTGGISGFTQDYQQRIENLLNAGVAQSVIDQAQTLIRNALPEAAKDAIAEIDTNIGDIKEASTNAVEAIGKEFDNATKNFDVSLNDLFNKYVKGSSAGSEAFGAGRLTDLIMAAIADAKPEVAFNMMLDVMETRLLEFASTLESTFGENGKLPATLAKASATMVDLGQNFGQRMTEINTAHEKRMEEIDKITDVGEKAAAISEATMMQTAGKIEAIASVVAAGLGAISSVFSAYMQQNIKEIDNLIEAEKKRDGKSAESLQRIQALEKKKEAMKKKEFETNKKLMLGQAIAATAAGIAATLPLLANPLTAGIATALIATIAAIGAAQVAIISKLKFQGSSPTVDSPNTSLTIGKRSGAVDVAQQTSAGELNYLRGGRTQGTDLGGAGAYLPGSAMGRKGYAMGFRKGYADGGVVVGERGPEIITPSADMDIVPNFALGGGETNVNFSINAIDAAGVEDVLTNQRGNIIRMIREAANENGERFLETVDTQTYGSNT